MKERILTHDLWEHVSGDKTKGDFISTEYLTFKNDTMIFDYGEHRRDTLILKYQYFSTMIVINPKTRKTGEYTMKGANWTDYLFK